MTLKSTMMAVAVVTAMGATAAPASAQPYDDRTMFTFNSPVKIPGAVLPAGTYLFRLADPESSRKVVQVLSEDGATVHGLFFTTPARRLDVAWEADVSLKEAPIGVAPEIAVWWSPGTGYGREFQYRSTDRSHGQDAASVAAGPVPVHPERLAATE